MEEPDPVSSYEAVPIDAEPVGEQDQWGTGDTYDQYADAIGGGPPPWADPNGEDLPQDSQAEEEEPDDEVTIALRKVGAFLPKDGHVTRQQAIEFINLQRWAREGCCQAIFAILLWLAFMYLVNVHSHIPVSYGVYKDIAFAMQTLNATASRGIAPAAIFSAAGTSMCHCSCPAICTMAWQSANISGVPDGAYVVKGTVVPEQLQDLRAKAHYLKNLGKAKKEKKFADLNTIDDVWFWLQHGMIPELWHEEPRSNPVNISLLLSKQSVVDARKNAMDPSRKPGHILRWSKVIGGVRLRQQRLRTTTDCRVDSQLINFFGQTCHKNSVAHTAFGPGKKNYVEGFVPTEKDKIATQYYDIYLDTERPIHIALESVQYMLKAHGWLDSSTDSLQVQVPFINFEATPALLGLMEIRFDFTRSGTVKKKIEVWTAAANPYDGFSLYIIPDLVWVGLLVYLLGKKIFKTVKYFTNKRDRHDTLCNFWFMFDWFTITFGFVLIILWFFIVSESAVITDEIVAMPPAPAWDAFQRAIDAYHKSWSSVLNRTSDLFALRDALRILQFVFAIQLIFQFLKSFRGQPKLAQLTLTLIEAAEDLIHFVLAFVVLFLSFAFTGHLVWGLRLKSWSSSTQCINSSFRALMGDVDLIAMYDISPVTTVVWFWLFLWCIIFVMNNLLLATLYDHFQIVKEQANTFTTSLLQMKDVLRDVYHREGFKTFCCICCCRCRKREEFPSHTDMLEALMHEAGYTPDEKHKVFRTVLGPKWMRKSTEKHAFAGEIPVEHLSVDEQAPAEDDLKRLGVDQDYQADLLDDIVNFREREFDTEEIHVNQMRELVALAEVEMAAMRVRLQSCETHMRDTMHDLVRRLEALERSAHGSLRDLVHLASAAGVPDKVEHQNQDELVDAAEKASVLNNVPLSTAYRRVMRHLGEGTVKRLNKVHEDKKAEDRRTVEARQQSNTYQRLHNRARLAHAFGPEELKRMHRKYDMR
jgi:hypothetical protein